MVLFSCVGNVYTHHLVASCIYDSLCCTNVSVDEKRGQDVRFVPLSRGAVSLGLEEASVSPRFCWLKSQKIFFGSCTHRGIPPPQFAGPAFEQSDVV